MQASGKRHIKFTGLTKPFTLYYVSDLHLMSKACAEKKLYEDLAAIKSDPYAFWIGGGDYVDMIGRTDKRFDPDAVAEWVSVEDLGRLGEVGYTKVRDLFMPIRHKCLGLLQGNHERKFELFQQQQHWTDWLCCELSVPNFGYSCLFDLVLVRKTGFRTPKLLPVGETLGPGGSRWTVRFFCHHGAGYAQTPGGKMNRLSQFMDAFEADVYCIGHVHDKIGRRQPILGANQHCTRIIDYDRIGVISGSYLRTYSQGTTTYGEQRGYRPVNLGMASVQLHPDESGGGRITGEI